MALIDELGYENAKFLINHPNQRTWDDSRILRYYGVADIDVLKRQLEEYQIKHNIVEKDK